ncbi:unnamed protein product, partial [Didymodactylos carnosus]
MTNKSTSRFTDLAEEPNKFLLPIEGYQNVELMSLENAVRSLQPIIDNLSRNVWIAKQNSRSPSDDLTVDQSASIHLYTMEWKPSSNSLYSVLNRTLREEDRDRLIPWFPYLKLFLTALSNLESVEMTVWRGIKADLSMKFNKGDTFVWWGISSCTESIDVLEKEQFLGKTGTRTLFNIQCKSGKLIQSHSYYKDENEILLMPGTCFQVKGKIDAGSNLHIIDVKETTAPYVLCESPFQPTDNNKTLLKNEMLNEDTYCICTLRLKDDTIQGGQASISSSQSIPGTERNVLSASCVKPTTETMKSKKNVFNNAELEKELKQIHSISDLSVTNHRIDDEDAKILADALKVNRTLTSLDLGENQISDKGGEAIADALKLNRTLTSLYLWHNKISVKGGEAIADALKVNRTLTNLQLWQNQISVKGGEAIADALKVNRTLTTLDLGANEISDKGGEAIADALKVNRTLTSLYLGYNEIADKGGEAIADALK